MEKTVVRTAGTCRPAVLHGVLLGARCHLPTTADHSRGALQLIRPPLPRGAFHRWGLAAVTAARPYRTSPFLSPLPLSSPPIRPSPPPIPLQPGGSCIYFKNMADSTAGPGAEKTVLSLQGYTAMAATDTGKPFGFRLVCPGQRTYTLAPEAETEECRTKWCVACGLDFVRLSGSLVVARSSSSHARCVPVGSSSSPA